MGLLLTLKCVIIIEEFANDPRGNVKGKNMLAQNDFIFPRSLPVIVRVYFKFCEVTKNMLQHVGYE